MLTVGLGYGVVEGQRVLLTCWPTGAGDLPDGGFDVDAWEDEQVHLSMVPGADPRKAWKVAYRRVREVARKMGGLEWFSIFLEDEPCPLPDRKPEAKALIIPKRIITDKGTAFSSRMVCDLLAGSEGNA
jgi:hypothetical protein